MIVNGCIDNRPEVALVINAADVIRGSPEQQDPFGSIIIRVGPRSNFLTIRHFLKDRKKVNASIYTTDSKSIIRLISENQGAGEPDFGIRKGIINMTLQADQYMVTEKIVM